MAGTTSDSRPGSTPAPARSTSSDAASPGTSASGCSCWSCVASIVFRGFNLGIDFKGGTQFLLPGQHGDGARTEPAVQEVFEQARVDPARADGRDRLRRRPCRSGPDPDARETVTRSSRRCRRVRPVEPTVAVAERDQQQRGQRRAGAAQITQQALIALVVFLVAGRRSSWRSLRVAMAVAAIVALLHDLVLTAGVYSLVGFEVTPVDRDRPADHPRLLALRHRRGLRQGPGEHPRHPRAHPPHLRRGGEPRRQPDADALDQHLADRAAAGRRPAVRRRRPARRRARSGPRSGAVRRHACRARYSSIFLATPLLVDLKMRDRRYKAQAARVAAARGRGRRGRGARRARTGRARSPTCRRRRSSPGELRRERRGRGGREHARRHGKPAQRRPARPAGKASRPTASDTGEPSSDRDRGRGARPRARARPRRPGLPQPGVLFRDITPVFADGPAFPPSPTRAGDGAGAARRGRRDRGARLPARRGRRATRPGPAWSRCARPASCRASPRRRTYDLEYGTATLELHADTFAPGSGCCVVDDVLATGGTAGGHVRPGRQAGAAVVGFGGAGARRAGRPAAAGAPCTRCCTV